MTTPNGLLEVAMLASLTSAERQRAQLPLVMTMLPGAPAHRGAVAAMAVTTQARDGLRRERRVASQVVDAVDAAVQNPGNFTTETLRQLPALRAIATDQLRDKIRSVTEPAQAAIHGAPARAGAPAAAIDPVVLDQAVGVAVALIHKKGSKLAGAEAERFPDFLKALSQQQRDQIVG